jgi:hypothetical protein
VASGTAVNGGVEIVAAATAIGTIANSGAIPG